MQAIAIRQRSSPVSQIMSFGLAVPRRLIRLSPARRHPIATSHWAAPTPIGTFLCNPHGPHSHNVDALHCPGLIQSDEYILRQQQALSPGIRQTPGRARLGGHTASQEPL